MSGTFTLTGKLLFHDKVTPHEDAPVNLESAAYPDPGDTVVYTQGASTVTDADGSFSFPSLLTESGLWYRVSSGSTPPLFATQTFVAPANGTTVDLSDSLEPYDAGSYTPSAVTQALAAAAAALAAVASVAYSTWQATTAYVSGQTIQAPDGSLIKANSTRTSRPSFDATEQGNWTPVATKTGTLAQVALAAQFLPATVLADSNGTDDSTDIAAKLAALPTGGTLRLKPGQTYRAHGLTVPVGATIDARGATVKVPDSVTALNMFTAAGMWRLIGGTFDGNKANTTDGGSPTTSCGVYQYAAGGWAGTVRLEQSPVFHDFHQHGVRAATDITAFTDADSAPDSAVLMESVEVHHCDAIGIYCAGLGGLVMRAPYAHDNGGNGFNTKLCRAPTHADVRAISNGGHGFSSLYCTDQKIDGQFDHNTNSGLVIGGDSSNLTNTEGRRFQLGRVTARYNGTGTAGHGLVIDATKTGSKLPVAVYGSAGSVLAEHNGGDGVVVTSSQYVDLGVVEANNNGALGVSLATANAGFTVLRARGNGQYGLALQGSVASPNWGGHRIGWCDFQGNTSGDTISYGTVLAPSQFALFGTAQASPMFRYKPAATTRNNTATVTNDPHLAFANVQPGVYIVEGFIPYDASTTADFLFSWAVPSGGSASWTTNAPTGGATTAGSVQMNRSLSTSITGAPNSGGVGIGSANALCACPVGLITVTTAGTVALKWAQNVAEASDCTVEAGAWVRLVQVA